MPYDLLQLDVISSSTGYLVVHSSILTLKIVSTVCLAATAAAAAVHASSPYTYWHNCKVERAQSLLAQLILLVPL